jgi:hypothetical protein
VTHLEQLKAMLESADFLRHELIMGKNSPDEPTTMIVLKDTTDPIIFAFDRNGSLWNISVYKQPQATGSAFDDVGGVPVFISRSSFCREIQ